MWSQFTADVRYAVRLAARRKLLTVAILTSVTLGIAGTGAIFAIVDQVLLRDVPVVDPHRVVWLQTQDASGTVPRQGAHPGDAFDWRERARSFDAIGWYNEAETTVRVGDTEPIRTGMALVSPDFARALGIVPVLGSMFTADDYPATGGSDAVIVSHRLWRSQLDADSNVIGRTIFLNNVARRVIAVLPPIANDLPRAQLDVWRPLLDNPQQRAQPRTASYMIAVGRIAPSATLASAQADMNRIASQLATEHPLTNATRRVIVTPLQEGLVGNVGPMLMLLGGTMLTLLLVACGNIGNLLLAQSSNRARELSVRMAIGGSRRRLVRQLATETALLCVAGGAAGLLIAPRLVELFLRLYPGGLPRAAEISVDWRVLVLSFAAIIVTSILAALPLIRQLLRLDPLPGLGGSARATMTRRQRRVASSLVMGQLALSMTLLTGGWLMMQTYVSIARTEAGIDTERLLAFSVAPSRNRYPGAAEVSAFYTQLHQKLRAQPGVDAVGYTNLVPFSSDNWQEYYQREGSNDALPNMPLALLQMANHELIDVLGLSLVRGRKLTENDREGSVPVVVVNSALAAAHYPGQDPVGKRMLIRGGVWEIVGVVSNKRHHALTRAPEPELFVPSWQLPPQLSRWVIVRTSVDPVALMSIVRTTVRDIDPTIAVAHLAPVSAMRAGTVAAERFRAVVLAAFAIFAATLATLGLYAVASDGVSRRTREIGLRMALGQTHLSISVSVLRESLTLAIAGIGVGSLASLLVSRLLQQFVGGTVWSIDTVLVVMGTAMLTIILIAATVPARRASQIQPMEALRAE